MYMGQWGTSECTIPPAGVQRQRTGGTPMCFLTSWKNGAAALRDKAMKAVTTSLCRVLNQGKGARSTKRVGCHPPTTLVWQRRFAVVAIGFQQQGQARESKHAVVSRR